LTRWTYQYSVWAFMRCNNAITMRRRCELLLDRDQKWFRNRKERRAKNRRCWDMSENLISPRMLIRSIRALARSMSLVNRWPNLVVTFFGRSY